MTLLKTAVMLAAFLTLTLSAYSEEPGFSSPRFRLALTGGTGIFRGGVDEGLGQALSFQPDISSATLAGSLSFRLARHLYVDLEVAGARGKDRRGTETPDNIFVSAGVRVPLFFTDGRLVPYLTLGGGFVNRQPQEPALQTIENAFDLKQTDPQGYAGLGVDVRLTRTFGVRADYRYVRIFPEDVKDLNLERSSYGAHRVTGGVTLSF